MEQLNCQAHYMPKLVVHFRNSSEIAALHMQMQFNGSCRFFFPPSLLCKSSTALVDELPPLCRLWRAFWSWWERDVINAEPQQKTAAQNSKILIQNCQWWRLSSVFFSFHFLKLYGLGIVVYMDVVLFLPQNGNENQLSWPMTDSRTKTNWLPPHPHPHPPTNNAAGQFALDYSRSNQPSSPHGG